MAGRRSLQARLTVTGSIKWPKRPIIPVVVDDPEEMHHALRFACGRAKAVGGKVALMYCIAPTDFEYWAGVGELMRAEAARKPKPIWPSTRPMRRN